MIKTQELEHLLKLAILSAYIKDERPVSILVCARVESGKTELIRKTEVCKGVISPNDCTAHGIQKEYLKDIADKKVRTIVIPDLITPLSRASDTVETFVTFLNGLIEEGIVEIQTYASSIKLNVPARCNIITSIAQEHLFDQRHRWSKSGFMSRVLPISYEYAGSTVYEISHSIATRDYHNENNFYDLKIPDDNITINLPKDVALQIASLAPVVIDYGKNAGRLYGFRLQKQLQTLCMANAILNNRETVIMDDFNKLKDLSDFINLNFKAI